MAWTNSVLRSADTSTDSVPGVSVIRLASKRDLEIAVNLQPVGENAGLQSHARRQHQPSDAVAGQHQFVGKQRRQPRDAQRTDGDLVAPSLLARKG